MFFSVFLYELWFFKCMFEGTHRPTSVHSLVHRLAYLIRYGSHLLVLLCLLGAQCCRGLRHLIASLLNHLLLSKLHAIIIHQIGRSHHSRWSIWSKDISHPLLPWLGRFDSLWSFLYYGIVRHGAWSLLVLREQLLAGISRTVSMMLQFIVYADNCCFIRIKLLRYFRVGEIWKTIKIWLNMAWLCPRWLGLVISSFKAVYSLLFYTALLDLFLLAAKPYAN